MKGNKDSKLKNIWNALKDNLDQLRRNIRWEYSKLKRALSWAIFGYKETDWDFDGFFIVWKFKLDRIYKEFKKCRVHDHKDDLKQMREMKSLLKIVSVDYAFEYSDKLMNKKWGGYVHKKLDWTSLGFCRQKVKNERDNKKYHKDWTVALKEGERLHQNALDKFLVMVKKYHFKWSC